MNRFVNFTILLGVIFSKASIAGTGTFIESKFILFDTHTVEAENAYSNYANYISIWGYLQEPKIWDVNNEMAEKAVSALQAAFSQVEEMEKLKNFDQYVIQVFGVEDKSSKRYIYLNCFPKGVEKYVDIKTEVRFRSRSPAWSDFIALYSVENMKITFLHVRSVGQEDDSGKALILPGKVK